MEETKKIELTEKTAALLAYMKANDNGDEGHTRDELAAGMGVIGIAIQGSLNSLVKKGFVAYGEPRDVQIVNKAGDTVTKSHKTLVLTDAGRDYQA